MTSMLSINKGVTLYLADLVDTHFWYNSYPSLLQCHGRGFKDGQMLKKKLFVQCSICPLRSNCSKGLEAYCNFSKYLGHPNRL